MKNNNKLKRRIELIVHMYMVGRWLAAAEEINGYMTIIGYYKIKFNIIP